MGDQDFQSDDAPEEFEEYEEDLLELERELRDER